MPFTRMDLRHPIDEEIRARLKAMDLNQVALGEAIGRSQGWVNKFLSGDGHATIDDIVRIAAVVVSMDRPALNDAERRVLRALRAVPQERREDAAFVMETAAKGYRRERRPESDAQADHTPPGKARKARGTR